MNRGGGPKAPLSFLTSGECELRVIERVKLLWQLYNEHVDARHIYDLSGSEYTALTVRATAESFNAKRFFWMPRLREKV